MLRRLINGFFRSIYDFIFRVGHGGRDQWSVLTTANEISILKNGRIRDSVRISDVERILAVSRDMATRDEIFLIFETKKSTFWIGEYYDGFDELSEKMKSAFQLRVADWYEELSKAEPFSNSEVVVWMK